jgi:hypothetical protein
MLTALVLLAAHPAPPVPPAPPAVREIMILRDGKDAAAAPRTGERREVRIIRRGAEGRTPPMVLERCEGKALADIDEKEATADGKQQRTRILVCSASGATSVGQVQHLRDTIKRIENDKNLSDETRARVIAALNSAIAALPAQE